MQETQKTWFRSLGQEDSFGVGNGKPPQFSGLENPMDRGVLQSMGSQRVGRDWAQHSSIHQWTDQPNSINKVTLDRNNRLDQTLSFFLSFSTWNLAICDNKDGSRGCQAQWNKSYRQRQIPYYLTYMWHIKNKHTENKFVVHRREEGKGSGWNR